MRQAGLFGLSDHLKPLSAHGDPLEELSRIIDFEEFRSTLVAALASGDGLEGGRPPNDPLAKLKVRILAAQNNVSDLRIKYFIRARLSKTKSTKEEVGSLPARPLSISIREQINS